MLAFHKFVFVLYILIQISISQGYKCDVPDEWLIVNNSIGSAFPGNRWPGGVVKYELHSSLSSVDRNQVQLAFDEYHAKTCIRFEERSPGEESYTSIEADDGVCGLADYCKTGGLQFTKFGGGCRNRNVMIHELGHTLCLGHEHSRDDRDQYVNFPGCGEDTPGKDTDFQRSGVLYDYTSQMHNQCNWCQGGWPTMSGVTECGSDVTRGLSVLDAEKINTFYNCSGCLGFRFRPVDRLTDQERRDMYALGSSITGAKLYPCRAYHMGDIVPGTYDNGTGTCNVPWGGLERAKRGAGVEVFVVPGSGSIMEKTDGVTYSWVQMGINGVKAIPTNAVPGGRQKNGGATYIITCDLYRDGIKATVIGKLNANEPERAYVPFYGAEVVCDDYGILTCE